MLHGLGNWELHDPQHVGCDVSRLGPASVPPGEELAGRSAGLLAGHVTRGTVKISPCPASAPPIRRRWRLLGRRGEWGFRLRGTQLASFPSWPKSDAGLVSGSPSLYQHPATHLSRRIATTTARHDEDWKQASLTQVGASPPASCRDSRDSTSGCPGPR